MNKHNIGSLLMISLHGYVAGSPELGKPDTGGQVVFVLELAKRFARLGYRVDVMTRQFEDQPRISSMKTCASYAFLSEDPISSGRRTCTTGTVTSSPMRWR